MVQPAKFYTLLARLPFVFLTEIHVFLHCLSVQSHGAWMAKSAMRHQPMQGHALGAVSVECSSFLLSSC